ncbi:MAG: hypothetical protein ACOCYN_04860, partial [Planctomycetota bacterium]
MSDLVLAILSQTSGRASQALRASSAELPAFGEALRQAQRAERPAAREAAAAPQEAAPAREVDVQDAAADAPVEDQPTRDQ